MAYDLLRKKSVPRDWSIGSNIDEEQKKLEEVANHALEKIQAKQLEVEKKFDSPLSIDELYSLVETAKKNVSIMANSISTIDAHTGWGQEKKDLTSAQNRLGTLFNIVSLLKNNPEKVPNIQMPLQPGSKWSNEFKKYVTVPYRYIRIGIQKAVVSHRSLNDILNTPSKALAYIADQLKKAIVESEKVLGIPKWILPVTLVGFGVTIAAGLYSNIRAFAPRRTTT